MINLEELSKGQQADPEIQKWRDWLILEWVIEHNGLNSETIF